MYSLSSDLELIQLYRKGNTQAFETLFYRYQEKIFSTISFLVKDTYAAEDIMQDVFCRIIDTIHAGKYNEEGKFLSWATCVAHNMCMDYFRKIKRKPTILTGDNMDFMQLIGATDTDRELPKKVENFSKIEDYINELPDDQRAVLVLKIYGNLKFHEIAALTGCSLNTALGRMRYAISGLRKKLQVPEKRVLAVRQ